MSKIICIVGPTGVGKTKLSIELAKIYNGEIINADSTQIYKDLDIATAKIKKEEMQGIRHHLLDIRDIKENYTVYDYQKDARECIKNILNNKKTPIIVGGTGLYIKACLYDYKFDKETIKIDYSSYTNEELYQKLISIDPKSNIHINNRKRIERALNYYDINKSPISKKEKTDVLLYDTIFIGLTTDRENLYDIINKRVDDMLDNGLLIEARKIYDTNIRTKAILTPIGYKELFPYFSNNKSLEECINIIKQKSRNYAKRQYTWFNNQMKINWFNTNYEDFNKTVEEIKKYIGGNYDAT